MTWATELNIIRRYLRDADQNIWSNDLLRGLYNQAQNELQQRTGILEDVTNIRIPPEFQGSYMYDYEWGYLDGSNKYQCLRNQGNNFSFCYRWEVQENYGTAGDTADEGTNYTHPFEAYTSETPGTPPPHPFPQNLHTIKGMYHDRCPLPYETKKNITRDDPSWVTRTGAVLAYYVDDQVSNHFYLYGKPSTVTWEDDAGQGMVTSVEDDTTDSEEGIITQRTGSLLSDELGPAIDVISDDDNILIVYDVTPTEINGLGDTTDFPAYLNKYIRYRVLQLAYGANTDGRIESLSNYWGERAKVGLDIVKRFRNNRYKDRDYVMVTQGMGRRSIRHPRLPDSYPQI